MRRFVVAGCVLLALPGCRHMKADPTEPELDDTTLLGEDGADTSSVETDSQLLTTSFVAASTSGGTLSLASFDDGTITTKGLGDATKAIYFPRGCLTVSVDDAAHTATYDFSGCAGPNGLLKVRGQVKATYAMANGALVLDLVGTNLALNKATVDWSAHAELTAQGPARTMHWTAQLSGTTLRGRDFSRTNDKTVTWKLGERCFGLSGTSDGTVKGREIKTEIAGFSRCQGGCPGAGGTITITNVTTDTKVEIDFDGSATAQLVTPKGTSSIPLLCTP